MFVLRKRAELLHIAKCLISDNYAMSLGFISQVVFWATEHSLNVFSNYLCREYLCVRATNRSHSGGNAAVHYLRCKTCFQPEEFELLYNVFWPIRCSCVLTLEYSKDLGYLCIWLCPVDENGRHLVFVYRPDYLSCLHCACLDLFTVRLFNAQCMEQKTPFAP